MHDVNIKKLQKKRWFFVILILVGAIINYLDRSNLSIASPIISKEFGLSPLEMGFLMSAFLWPYAIANLPAGLLVDKFGSKKLFGTAISAWSIISTLLAFTNTYYLFYTLRALLGIAESPFFPAATKAINNWFSKNDRGTPLAIINTGSQIANGIAPPLLTALMLAFSWHIMFIIIGISGLIVALIWFYYYREPTNNELTILQIEIETNNMNKTSKKISWSSLFKYPSTWYMIIGNFGLVYTMWTYLTWLPSYLVNARGLSLLNTGWVAAIPFLVGIIGVPLGGIISDYFIKNKGYAPIKARKIPLVVGASIAAIAVAPIPYISNINLCIFMLSLGYFASSVPTGVIWTLATDVAPKNMVASLGSIQNFGGFIGAALAPIVTGFIIQITNDFSYVFIIGAILLVISAISYGVFLQDPIKE